MFWSVSCVCVGTYFNIAPTHTKNYTKADIKQYLVCMSPSLFRELDNIDGSMKRLHLKHFF